MNRPQLNSSTNLTALVADDDAGIQLTLSALLQQKGYTVTSVGDGVAAVEALSNDDFNIVLLDIRMPKMDGFEACRSMRKLENGHDVPILMLTGQDDTESIEKAFEVGATDFVAKPINLALMGFRIDYLIRASNNAEELRKAQQRSNHAQRIANLGHIEWNTAGEVVHCSKGVRQILSLPLQKQLDRFEHFLDFVHADDKDRVETSVSQSLTNGDALNLEHRMVQPDGSVRFVQQISERRRDTEASSNMVVTLQDITDRIDTEKRIHALAYYDELTGLPNRNLLMQHLDRTLMSSMRYQTTTAVIVFGVDRFDKLVESLDHDSAENLTRMIAERIAESCRESDLLSRQPVANPGEDDNRYQQLTAKLRNDEYVIVLSEINNTHSVSMFLQRLVEQFKRPFQVGDQDVYVTTTAGVSLSPMDGEETNQLIKYAEMARGSTNKGDAGSFKFFKQELNEQVTRNFSLANDLRKALEEETLEVYYQPKISLVDDAFVGVEALCRWNHPVLGAISPIEFIEIAEEENLIGELGIWVLKTACIQTLEWKTKFNCDFIVSVNISPVQLLDEKAMGQIFDYVSNSPIKSRSVELELTESSLLADFDASLNILNQFMKLGCGLAIDDFGTGYSSLSYLGKLPAKTLKIDQSFIRSIGSSKQYTDIVSGIIKLAHSIGMTVIAEGVETSRQKEILRHEHCDEIQGMIVSMPLSPQDFTDWWSGWEAQRGSSSYEHDAGEMATQWL